MHRQTAHPHLLALMALMALVATAGAATITVDDDGPADHTNLHDAVAAASAGDVIAIADGTYPHTSTLDLDVPLTIDGESEAGVILEVATAGWGIKVDASDVTLQDFTMQIVNSGPEQGFAIHATAAVPEHANLSVLNVTIQGNDGNSPKRRAGLDINRFDGVTLTSVTSTDSNWGTGVQLSGCHDVTMTDVVTADNVWGGIAIFCTQYPTSEPPRGSDDVTIVSATNAEAVPIYREDEFGVTNTNITLPAAYQHIVRNETHRPDGDEFYFYRTDLNDAVAAALGFTGFESDSYIYELADPTQFWVGTSGTLAMSIQTAVDQAQPGDTVNVTAGTFEEQVVVAKDLSLLGDTAATTTILSPNSLSDSMGAGDYYPVVHARDGANLDIAGLTIDGAGRGNSNYKFVGLGFRNAGGSVDAVAVTAVRNDPLDGSQHGVGIYLNNDDGTPRSLSITGSDVDDFQKNGITLNAAADELAVTVTGNTVTGAGELTYDDGDPAQNGIQVYGADITGVIQNNTISGIAYDNTNNPTKWVATSLLNFYSGVDILENDISQGHVGLYMYGATGDMVGNTLAIEKVGVASYGILFYNLDPTKADPAGRLAAVPAPVGITGQAGARAEKALLPILVDGNDVGLVGPDNTATIGLVTGAGYGADDVDLTVSGNSITGFETGVDIFQDTAGGVFTGAAVNGNNLQDNATAIVSTLAGLTVDASCNWYGGVGGPDNVANPNPGAPLVAGDVLFTPWLDAAAPGGACVLYGDDNVSVGDGECLTDDTTCTDLTVTFDRTNTDPSRGVSTTIQLSPELELCDPTVAANFTLATGSGAWADGYGNTTMQIYDNGGGSYTVDLAVLGSPCGPTTGGDLFTVSVQKAAGVTGDALGTVSVTAADVRDCDNATLPGVPGAPGEVVIDQTAPAALADLAAVQVKTGNGSDGLTGIELSWTAPGGDADYLEIWRKGYGDYPEYDDGTGAEPTGPVTTANGWTKVAEVAPSSPTTYVDEPADRDFWSYAAYVVDACGNRSAVSDLTGGTLNYHLGDVTDTAVPGQGDNDVMTADLSLLGANYGATLATNGDPLNYVDVGPTTDLSADARPTTDNVLQFEDLMMFALNYGQVSKRDQSPLPAAGNAIALDVGPANDRTLEVAVRMTGDGQVQGLSIPLVWDRDVVEPVGVRPGELIGRQGGLGMVLSPEPGVVDAALMGIGDRGLSGEGVLAHVSFRVQGAGDPQIALGEITARDAQNQQVAVSGTSGGGTPGVVPTVSSLAPNVPNPFNPSTEVRFRVASDGPVKVQIYNLRGRLVRTLVEETRTAGEHAVTWNGTDDSGRSVASGSYVVRMIAPDRTDSRHITLVK